MIVRLEQDDSPPSMSEEKLTAVAEALELDPDEVVVLAGKIPQDVKPETAYEVALYRWVKQLSQEEREKLLPALSRSVRGVSDPPHSDD